MVEKEKINLALIGCGLWGPNIIRNFSQLNDVNISKICDLDKNKLKAIKEQYPNIKTTQNYEEIVNDNEINAIAIATPVSTHFELAKKALEAGKHVFVEKPITSTSSQAETLLQLASNKDKILMVDHTFNYSPTINKLKEIIESEELGNIHYLHAEWLSLGRLQPEVNVIWDLAVHIFSIIDYILQKKPVSLTASATSYFRPSIEEVANITLNYPGNIKALVTISWLEPEKTRKLTIIGNKKMLVYNMMDSVQLKVYNKTVNINNNKITYTDEEFQQIKTEQIEPLFLSCSHFIDCIKQKKQPRSSGKEGLDIVRVLEATNESIANNGKEVTLK